MIGAVLAIVAVICSGGLALVPMLTALLTTLGVSAAMATTIATVASLTIAGIAIVSTLGSSALNIVDTWCDMSENSTFKSWQTAMNWISIISNGLYSIGAIYNSVAAKLANVGKGGTSPNTSLSFEEALCKLEYSGLKPGQNVISRSRVMEIIRAYDPVKANSSVYTDITGRYLVDGHHTTVAAMMLGKGTGPNMSVTTLQLPSVTNMHWTKLWYEFWKQSIKVVK